MFRILVVDDDKNTRLLFRTILEKANYTVFVAKNGEDALDVMEGTATAPGPCAFSVELIPSSEIPGFLSKF